MPEPLGPDGALELPLGPRVGNGIVVDELDRPPDHHMGQFAAQIRLAAALQFGDKQAEHVDEGQQALLDAHRFLDQLRAQYALERPHQPPVGTRDVLG